MARGSQVLCTTLAQRTQYLPSLERTTLCLQILHLLPAICIGVPFVAPHQPSAPWRCALKHRAKPTVASVNPTPQPPGYRGGFSAMCPSASALLIIASMCPTPAKGVNRKMALPHSRSRCNAGACIRSRSLTDRPHTSALGPRAPGDDAILVPRGVVSAQTGHTEGADLAFVGAEASEEGFAAEVWQVLFEEVYRFLSGVVLQFYRNDEITAPATLEPLQ